MTKDEIYIRVAEIGSELDRLNKEECRLEEEQNRMFDLLQELEDQEYDQLLEDAERQEQEIQEMMGIDPEAEKREFEQKTGLYFR